MANNFVFNDSLPVAPLKLAALESCKDFASKVDSHIVQFRRNDMEELKRRKADLHYRGYDVDSYLLDFECPRFGTGEAKAVINADAEIDEMEKDIEKLCLKLLLQQQPVAKDLRQISAALKMITDMERIGDHAADISEMTILMAGTPYIRNIEHLQTMAKEAMVMLVKSIEAYVEKDLAKAEKVIESDDIIDDLFDKIKAELIDAIHQNPDNGEQAADLLMVSKYLERIGDHATNIAEWVIFSITGNHPG